MQKIRSDIPEEGMEVDEDADHDDTADSGGNAQSTDENETPAPVVAESPPSEAPSTSNRPPAVHRPSMNSTVDSVTVLNKESIGLEELIQDEDGGLHLDDIYIPPAPKPTLSMENTGPRLIITKIVNHNFKSYAGTQVLGPFHKSYTSIIGPNGSGKSNVIDSMLFVFGYRATKIRCKKLSVLLHKSSKFPNIKDCTVAVHFVKIIDKGGDDEYDVIPNTELVISRTAFSDNSSYYTLNGKRVQFKEVAKVLESHGIDLDHNRFLILQGEVEQIALMRPKGANENDSGMLEYLEDIIGTSRFKEPIGKLVQHVETLTESRKDKLMRVKHVEEEKSKLEGPKNEAIEQLNIINSLTRTKNTLLQKHVLKANKKIEKVEEDRQKQKDELDEIDRKLGEIKSEKEEQSKILGERNKKFETMEQQKEELTDKFRKMKSRDVQLQADSTQMSKRKKNIEGVLEPEKSKLMDFKQIPDKNRSEIDDYEKQAERFKKQKVAHEEEIQEVMSSVREVTQSLHEQKDKIQLELIERKKTRDEAKKNFTLAESELKLYLSKQTKESDKLKELQESLEQANTGIQEKKEKMTELHKSVPNKEKLLTNAKNTQQRLQTEERELQSKVKTLRNQVEESRSTASANKYRGQVLTALMNEKKSNLPGIYGRLGDLAGIDSKYDVAISTCCGALDNIVVDTADTGQRCIEFLRRNDLGRATFIIAEKQEYLREQYTAKKNFPENAPRLFDLLRISDERVRPAFYYALRDTLVAKDMDQASRIAYQGRRHRVVTLGGDVIEIAGTMSGGGNRVIRGRIGTSAQVEDEIDPRVIKKQEEDLAAMSERLREVHMQLQTIGGEISTLTRECSELKMQRERTEMEYKSLVEQSPALKAQIKEQTEKVKKCSVDPKKKQELERKAKDLELILEKANVDAEKVEKEVKAIHEKIVEVGGGRLRILQKEVDEIDKKLEKIRTEITKMHVAIKTSERNAKKSQEKINQMEKEIGDLEVKLENIKKEKNDLTRKASNVQEELEQLQEQLSERDGEFGDLKEKIAELTAAENKLKAERLEITAAMSKIDKSRDEIKLKLKMWNRELNSLVLEKVDIPDYEQPAPLAKHTPEELDKFSTEDLQSKVKIQEERLGEQKPNLQAILEYKAKELLYLERFNELEQITDKRNKVRNLHDVLCKSRFTEFMAGFNTITSKLKEMYQMITLGGDAELELVDSLDPFTEGIAFSVRPPGKSWKAISNLSGGEKTLSSLSLVFALHYYKPSPLYVMDEIDAALDFKNVSIVGNYVKDRTKNAQFIIISLRYNMFELANRLVGIYKTEDCTKSVTIQNDSSLTVPVAGNDPKAQVA